MSVTWVCRTCEQEIAESAIEDHEEQGHDVKGFMVPDRLLANDPWQLGSAPQPDSDDEHPEE